MAKRFASHSDQEIDQKRANLVPKNTEKANKRCANVRKQYLRENSMDEDFEMLPAEALDDILSHFSLDLRKTDGTEYKTSSLENVRHGLKRYLNNPPFNRNIDLLHDKQFAKSNQSLKTALAELKCIGKGDTDHYPCIADSDLHKMYSSLYLSTDTPSGLLNKVQFEIRLYFCRRGSENIADMTKSTFKVCTDPNTGAKFVKKVCDELTKNRRENEKEGYSGIMPSDDSPLCPVASFLKYLDKLNPKLDRLWQHRLDSFTESGRWFKNSPIGKHTLSKFMSSLSKTCDLSQTYTNHSVRATGVTILTRGSFSAAQIMSLTGHKSVNSLALYHRVSDQEKVQMGQAITSHVRGGSGQPALPAPLPRPAITGNMATPTSLVPQRPPNNHSQLNGINLNDIFGDFFSGDLSSTSLSVNTTIRPAPMTMFSGCQIGSVQVVVNKSN